MYRVRTLPGTNAENEKLITRLKRSTLETLLFRTQLNFMMALQIMFYHWREPIRLEIISLLSTVIIPIYMGINHPYSTSVPLVLNYIIVLHDLVNLYMLFYCNCVSMFILVLLGVILIFIDVVDLLSQKELMYL